MHMQKGPERIKLIDKKDSSSFLFDQKIEVFSSIRTKKRHDELSPATNLITSIEVMKMID